MCNGLKLENVSFAYHRKQSILKDVSLTLNSGKITALVGENGCGKTTLIKLITGVLPPQSGGIFYDGQCLTQKNINDYHKVLGYMPEDLNMYPNEKVHHVLSFFAYLRQCRPSKEIILKTLDQVGLLKHKDKKVSALSKGLRQRLNLAQAIIHQPKVAIFDEPSNGFDYKGVQLFYTVIKSLAKKGAAVLITSHLFSELWDNTDNILLMSRGKIIRQFNAKFGHVNINDTNAINKRLWVRVPKTLDQSIKGQISKITASINYLDEYTFNTLLRPVEVEQLIGLLQTYGYAIADIQVDSLEIENELRSHAHEV